MSIKSSSKHLLDDFFQIVSSYSKNVILFLYAFFYFPSLLLTFVFISLITRMRYKRDIKMGRLYTPGGAVIGIVGGGVTFRFF